MLSDGVIALRQWRDDDAEWYAEAVRDPEIQRYTSEPEDLTADQVRAAIAALADEPHLAGFLVCDAATGERLGNIGLRRGPAAAEVSYWVAAPARGRGVAARAIRLLSDWAIATHGLSELRLWTHADNAASGRAAERAGYRRAPEHDRHRTVKGHHWHNTAYRRPAVVPSPPAPGEPARRLDSGPAREWRNRQTRRS